MKTSDQSGAPVSKPGAAAALTFDAQLPVGSSQGPVARLGAKVGAPGRRWVGRGTAWRGGWLAVGAVGGVLSMAPMGAEAQETTELITTELPFPQYYPIRDDHYGLRIGRLQVRYDLSTEFVFTDNRNYSNDDRESDFGIRPVLTLGLFYPVNDRQRVQVDVGVGYQWWANVTDQNRFYVAPRSHVSYALGLGNVDVLLSNTTSSTAQASDRVEIAGGAQANGVNNLAFNRINNRTTLGAGWRPGRVGFSGNYSFLIDRSLTDQFQSIDQDRHTFGGAVTMAVTSPITVGLAGNYSIYTYLQDVQNDGTGYSLTPTLQWRLRDNLQLEAAVGYGETTFDRTGTIQDNDNFAGVTYDISVRHQINKRMNHSAQFSRGADPGLGSNFTDRFLVSYQLTGQISEALRPFLNFQYQRASISGVGGEDADQFRINLGAGYPIFRRATLGFNYGIIWRVADDPNREYVENRVSLMASYRF